LPPDRGRRRSRARRRCRRGRPGRPSRSGRATPPTDCGRLAWPSVRGPGRREWCPSHVSLYPGVAARNPGAPTRGSRASERLRGRSKCDRVRARCKKGRSSTSGSGPRFQAHAGRPLLRRWDPSPRTPCRPPSRRSSRSRRSRAARHRSRFRPGQPSRWLVGNWRGRGDGPDQARVCHRPQARLEALTRARVRPGAVFGPPSVGVVSVDQPSNPLSLRSALS
jgi:hypothetical protein